MPMSPRLLRPRATGTAVFATDADARAYISAVNAADGQALEQNVQLAIDAFVIGCKADGIWNAIKASCILMGARTLSGALTPLVGSAPTPFNFAASDYNRRTGLIGNGSNRYLNTNRAGNADPQNNFHASVFGTALDSGGGSIVRAWLASGSAGNATKNIGLFHFNGAYYFNVRRDSGNTLVNAALATSGFVGAIRTSSTNVVGRFSGADNTFSVPSQPPTSDSITLFAGNQGGTLADYSASRLAFYSVGESLTLASLDSRVSGLYGDIGYAIDNPTASIATLHPEARDWVRRVYFNGGTVSASTAAAVNTFCNAIDAAGIRDRFYRLNLFCGDNLAAALVPLYRAESSTASARGNTTDTNNGPFVEADYVSTGSTGGLIGNGTSKFLNTGLAANSMTATDVHLAISLRTAQTAVNADKTAIGTYSTTGQLLYGMDLMRTSGNPFGACCFGNYNSGGFFGESVAFGSAGTAAVGHIVASSIAAAANQYRNGSVVGTNGTTRTNYSAAHSLYVYANNNGNGSGAAVNITNARLGGYSIGLGMTQSQVTAYSNAMAAFNTALSRT